MIWILHTSTAGYAAAYLIFTTALYALLFFLRNILENSAHPAEYLKIAGITLAITIAAAAANKAINS